MNVILAGSATGGHIYPAIAIADKIKTVNPQAKILFISAKKELGSTIVSDNGYDVEYINVQGFNRKNLIKNVGVAKDLLVSSQQIKKIFKKFKPDLVIGTGGYVSGPVLKEAGKSGIKAYIHEQNVLPGLANKMAQKYVDKVFVAFEDGKKHFKNETNVIVTGNPVRTGFVTAASIDYRERLNLKKDDFAVLIFGGSTGAKRINEVTVELLEKLNDSDEGRDVVIYFITGRREYWDVRETLELKHITDNEKFNVIEYTEVIHEYFAVADLIVGRSGALTVSEITACGKPSILIPSPNVSNNHQYYNAKPLEDAGAAVLITEDKLDSDMLYEEIMTLKNSPDDLKNMAESSKALGRIDAVEKIYDELGLY